MFLQRFLRFILVPVLFMATLSTATLHADDDLTDEQLHAVMGIIVNFILSDETKHFAITSAAVVTVVENQTFAIDVNVKDATGVVTYAISGGDAGEFSVDASTGVITFNNAPDFETRTTYTFTVTATDAYGNTSTQDITINISDVVDRLKKTGQTTSYYTGDDGTYQTGVTPSYSRVNEVVTDNVTGLEWQDNVEAKTTRKNWADAQTYCSSLGLDGGGWRLPSRKELVGLSDYGQINPGINPAFVNTMSYRYWSSTAFPGTGNNVWVVNFYQGYLSYDTRTSRRYVRCVRSGQP